MANKIEIKKFLERKKEESLQKLKDESKQKQEAARSAFYEPYKDKFHEIREKVVDAGVEYEELVKTIKDLGIARFPNSYRSPISHFNDLLGYLSDGDLLTYYIEVGDAEKIRNSFTDKIDDCRREYDGLIAVCNVNNAKDSIKILENLGFDTSEVELKKEECTTLITNIDASKLFIVKEDK